MNILFNMFSPVYGGGFKTYNYNMVKGLRKYYNQKNQYFILINKKSSNSFDLPLLNNVHIITVSNYFSTTVARYLWLQFILPIYLITKKIDVLFSPMNIAPVVLFFLKVRSVLVIHTNLPWLYPKALDEQPWYYNKLQTLFTNISIYNSDIVIVDSNTAKNELNNIFPGISSKVRRIYLGVDRSKFKNTEVKSQVSKKIDIFKEKYFLTVSSIVTYHCFLELFEAYEMLCDANKLMPKLVCISNVIHNDYNTKVIELLKNIRCPDKIIIIPTIDSELLPIIYQNSELYIFSSYCEVFGFTNLEAMACGTPVLTSNKSALPEICEDAAIYFNPFDPKDIKDKINHVYNDMNLRNSLIIKGKKQVEKFTWEKTVSQTFDVLFQNENV